MNKPKSFTIPKQLVVEGYGHVKRSGGGAGIDNETMKEFEEDLINNMYRIWNRMSSGTYFPKAVKTVEIPKTDGGKRKLGIPTITDRIAQSVVKQVLEPRLEKIFHKESYGYRPNKSQHQAISEARRENWEYDWVLDVDIKGFFDNINHDKMMSMVERHSEEKWVRLYVKRWLEAKIMTDEHEEDRIKGTPQGGVISPLLANLYLHYAFDEWIKKEYPKTKWERFADDIIVHCISKEQAEDIKCRLAGRLKEFDLEINETKTSITYNKDDNRREDYDKKSYEFLGYEFRARVVKGWRGYFTGFTPAISKKSKKKIRNEMKSWKLWKKQSKTLEEIAGEINPKVRGWINYYGKYSIKELKSVLYMVQKQIKKWAKVKYKKLRRGKKSVNEWIQRKAKYNPNLFSHWEIGLIY